MGTPEITFEAGTLARGWLATTLTVGTPAVYGVVMPVNVGGAEAATA